MNTSTIAPEISAFAAGVRAALADLPSEEVDDLTEGLEADLAESLAEDLRRTLPDPVAYAAELRLAAGLPGRTVPAARTLVAGLVDTWHGARSGLVDTIQRNPALVAVVEFMTVLRPAWWVLRAWIATWLLASFFGSERGYWFESGWPVLFAVLAVVSIQWGRGLWRTPGVRGVIVLGNVVAVVALLPVLAAADGWSGDDYGTGFDDGVNAASTDAGAGGSAGQGLAFNGNRLENIYAYDAAGKPLRNVQLFDVDGNPLVTDRNGDDVQLIPAPAALETGAEAYNVFPLSLTKMIWDENGDFVPEPTPDPDKTKAFRDGPFLKVPAVVVPKVVAPSNQ